MAVREGPSIGDRYLRSIGLAVGAVMVGVVAYPIVGALVAFGIGVSASDSEDYFSDSSSDSSAAPLFFLLAGLIGLVAVLTILTLAWLSLVALARAGTAFGTAEELLRQQGQRAAMSPKVVSKSSDLASVDAGPSERVHILSDAEKSVLRGIAPATNAAGWYVDPLGRAGGRWWNGVEWTGRTQGAAR